LRIVDAFNILVGILGESVVIEGPIQQKFF
jgi:hypothetical protein